VLTTSDEFAARSAEVARWRPVLMHTTEQLREIKQAARCSG
jgi:hypothetical protein